MRCKNISNVIFAVALFAIASLLPLLAPTCTLAQEQVQAPSVQINGQNCTMVMFKVKEGNSTGTGILQVVGRGKQLEWQLVLSNNRSSDMVYQKAIEKDRDQWSVYLDSESHNISIDLYQKKVKIDGKSFPILSSSNQGITHSVNQIKIADNESNKTIKLEKTGAATWNLIGRRGTEPLKVVEIDPWSIFLAKESDFNNDMKLQVDFYQNKASSDGEYFGTIASFSGDDRRPAAVQINEKPNQPRESKSVEAIDYQRPGDGSFKGQFIKTGGNTWEERNRDGVYQFRERSRTGSSITLLKNDRSMVLVVDLDARVITWDGHLMYRVTGISSAAKDSITPNNRALINQITWATSGGGQLEFDLGNSQNGNFAYRIRSYNFEDTKLQGEITSRERELHRLLSEIFTGRHDLSQHKFSYEGRMGGSWTKLTVYRGQKQETIQISATGKLGVIYDFMAKAAKKSAPKDDTPIQQISWSTTGGGQLEFILWKFANGNFGYDIESYNFRDVKVKGEITSRNGEMHKLLDDIFAGRYDVTQHKSSPRPGVAGGSWTKLTLHREQEDEEIRISTSGKLESIYDFMAKAAKSADRN